MTTKFKCIFVFALVLFSAITTSCSKEDNTIEITDPKDPEKPDNPQGKVYNFESEKVLERKSIKEDKVSSIDKLASFEEKVKSFTPEKITLEDDFIVLEYENEHKGEYGLKIENDKVLVNLYGKEYIHLATLNPSNQSLIIEQSFYEWFGFNAKQYVSVNLSGQEYNYSLEQNLQDFADLQGRKGNFFQVQLIYTLSK